MECVILCYISFVVAIVFFSSSFYSGEGGGGRGEGGGGEGGRGRMYRRLNYKGINRGGNYTPSTGEDTNRISTPINTSFHC